MIDKEQEAQGELLIKQKSEKEIHQIQLDAMVERQSATANRLVAAQERNVKLNIKIQELEEQLAHNEKLLIEKNNELAQLNRKLAAAH